MDLPAGANKAQLLEELNMSPDNKPRNPRIRPEDDPDNIAPPDKQHFEEPDLSPEDEELLDKMWDEIVRRKQAGLDPYSF